MLAVLQGASCAGDPAKASVDASTASSRSAHGTFDGATETDPSPCSTMDPMVQAGDAAELFSATKVPTFDVYLPPRRLGDLEGSCARRRVRTRARLL